MTTLTRTTLCIARARWLISRTALCLLVANGLALPAYAGNYWFDSQSAIAHMSPEDQALFKTTLVSVLNDKPDGSTTNWNNPKTGTAGRIAVNKTHPEYGTTCRLVKIENTAKKITRGGYYQLCKDKKDIWRFAPMPNSGR